MNLYTYEPALLTDDADFRHIADHAPLRVVPTQE